MESNVFKTGCSLAVRIPKIFASDLGLCEGDKINMIKEGKEIKITKPDECSLDFLFEGYDGNYKASELDWGEDIGDEKVWTKI